MSRLHSLNHSPRASEKDRSARHVLGRRDPARGDVRGQGVEALRFLVIFPIGRAGRVTAEGRFPCLPPRRIFR